MSRAPTILLAIPPSATPATVSYRASYASTSGLTTYTFSTSDIGTAATGRRVIVGVTGYSTTAGRTISSATIGGNSATISAQFTDAGGAVNSQVSGIIILQVDTGTTADIAVTFSGAMLGAAVQVFAAYDLQSSTATGTIANGDSPPSGTINCDAGGIIVGCASTYAGSTATHTWAGITERVDAELVSQNSYTAASSAFSSAQSGLTVSSTPTANIASSMSVAAYR